MFPEADLSVQGRRKDQVPCLQRCFIRAQSTSNNWFLCVCEIPGTSGSPNFGKCHLVAKVDLLICSSRCLAFKGPWHSPSECTEGSQPLEMLFCLHSRWTGEKSQLSYPQTVAEEMKHVSVQLCCQGDVPKSQLRGLGARQRGLHLLWGPR